MIGADAAGIDRIDIAAKMAGNQPFVHGLQRAQQRFHRAFAPFEQMQHRAPRRTGTKSGQARQGLRERFYFW